MTIYYIKYKIQQDSPNTIVQYFIISDFEYIILRSLYNKYNNLPISTTTTSPNNTIDPNSLSLSMFENIDDIYYKNKQLAINSPSGVKSLVFPQSEGLNHKIPLFVHLGNGKVLTAEEYKKLNKD